MLIPITDSHLDYAYEVMKKLKAEGIRAQVNDRPDRMNAKIRDAQKEKIPYMLVVGDNEVESGQVALRMRSGDNLGPVLLEDFIARAKQEIADHI
jgi:threonyl-tRNA synthetase